MSKPLDFRDEIVKVLKLAVNAGEANIGDLVQLEQVPHGDLADHVAFDFSLMIGQDFPLDRGGQLLDLFLRHGTFPAGPHDAAHDFFAIEGLFLLVLLDDRDLQFGHPFKRGVAISTLVAMAAAANHEAVVTRSAINDAVVIFAANRTTHK